MALLVKPATQAVAATALGEAAAARSAFASDKSQVDVPGDIGGGPAAASASKPLPVYSVAIETLAADASGALEAAAQCGWRVLTTHGGERQLVDLMGDEETAVPMAVLRSESAEMLVKAGALAEKSVEPHVDYEARVLDLGRLGMASLWLHNEDPNTPDHFFTLEAEPKERAKEELLEEAHSRAQQRVKRDAETHSAAGHEDALDDMGG